MITAKQMERLRQHAKSHAGGMRGKHMRNMMKFMRAGDSFAVAHNKAKKLDMPKRKPRARAVPRRRLMGY
jgi:predicted RNA-binding protein with PUA-like domain